MLIYKKDDILKLKDGREVKVVNLPNSFMANGSYEVLDKGQKIWVKPEEVLYQIDLNNVDDINLYFEIIWDENGLNLIPKDSLSVDIESDREDFNRIKFNFNEGRKHNTVNIHIGDSRINDKEKITIRPKKKQKSKLEKIIDVFKEKK
jgi:hypothetical protein